MEGAEMTKAQAIEKATQKAQQTGDTYLAICRTDHPHIVGEWCYVIAADAKHSWTPGETELARV